MTGALLLFAKDPVPGRVKTRLCPPLSAEQAAGLYACMLDDTLEESAAAAAQLGLVPVLCFDPPSAEAAFRGRAPGFELHAQRGPDLGSRMEEAVRVWAARGHTPLLLRGTDSPALPRERMEAALAALAGSALVLSPDPDGGYHLVGLTAPCPGLFDHAMSTASVLEDTLRRARSLGLRCQVLPEGGFDVDRVEDLLALARARAAGQAANCPRTLGFLDREGLWPAP